MTNAITRLYTSRLFTHLFKLILYKPLRLYFHLTNSAVNNLLRVKTNRRPELVALQLLYLPIADNRYYIGAGFT